MKNKPTNDWNLSNYDLSDYSDEDIEAIIYHVLRFRVVPPYVRRNLKKEKEKKESETHD